MNIAASEPLLSKLKNSDSKQVGFNEELLIDICMGLERILADEVNVSWLPNKKRFFQKIDAVKFEPKRFLRKKRASGNSEQIDVRLHSGRRSQGYKVDFMATAQKEVLEVGIRLRAFRDYLYSGPDIYRQPVEKLLQRGVNFKCYLLDPAHENVKAYINDLATARAEEIKTPEIIASVTEDLKDLCDEFRAENYPGHFELYSYTHIPQNHFFVVDNKDTKRAKMIISNYIFGVRRSQCFVMEFSKHDAEELYKLYEQSLHKLIKDAQLIVSSA